MENFSINKTVKLLQNLLGKGSHSLHEPSMGKEEIRLVSNTIKKNFVSTKGIYVKDFEDKIQRYTKSKYATSTINGTYAIFIALKVLGVKPNDEVLVPSLTFIGTVNAISYLGAKPHFVDSNIQDFGIDCKKLENYLSKISVIKKNRIINKKTGKIIKAIIPVHVFGHPCDIENIIKLSKKFKLKVVEDAAECVGSFYKKKHLGTFGDLGCLSFNGNKIITTGGGGAILSKSKKLNDKIRHLITTAKVNHKWEYIHDKIGYNLRLPSLNAALGIAQMKKINKFLRSKRKLFLEYSKIFKNIDGVKIFKEKKNSRSNYWLQTLIFEKNFNHIKNKLIKAGYQKKIYMRPVWRLISELKPYRNYQKMDLSGAKSIYKNAINLPSSQKLINNIH